jgi:hypothetical protein
LEHERAVAVISTLALRLESVSTQRDALMRSVGLRDVEIEKLTSRLQAILAVSNEQAEDEGLWFQATTAPEAYLQQELRKLHASIEGGVVERV